MADPGSAAPTADVQSALSGPRSIAPTIVVQLRARTAHRIHLPRTKWMLLSAISRSCPAHHATSADPLLFRDHSVIIQRPLLGLHNYLEQSETRTCFLAPSP